MLARETSRRHRKRFITTNPSRTPHTESQKFTIQELTRTSGILRIVLNARTNRLFFCWVFFFVGTFECANLGGHGTMCITHTALQATVCNEIQRICNIYLEAIFL